MLFTEMLLLPRSRFASDSSISESAENRLEGVVDGTLSLKISADVLPKDDPRGGTLVKVAPSLRLPMV